MVKKVMTSQVSIPHVNQRGEGQGDPTGSAVRKTHPATEDRRGRGWGRCAGQVCAAGNEDADNNGDEDAKGSDSKADKEETRSRSCKAERTRPVVDYLWARGRNKI